ncbi:MAG TPA: hypothetical protein VM934_06525 [Pyrinomonadaceae bacterium]|jgi:hypothetical protein|nr:hypothetical protein [Pyrinomonadaceae bacterium]
MQNSSVRLAAATTLALMSLAAPLNVSRAQTKTGPQTKGEPSVVFAVTKNQSGDASAGDAMIDPIVIVNRGKFAAPPGGDSGEEANAGAAREKRFIADFYRPGRQYRLLFGGGEAGTASVVKYIEPGCVGIEAGVVLQTAAKLGGQVGALATNSNVFARGQQSTRRTPSESERAAALKLAQSALRQKGVKDTLIAKMETINLTAVDLDRDKKAELVGAFIVNGAAGIEHALFMVFEPEGSDFRAALNWYYRTPGEAEVQYRRLVDVLDLDGDGVAEILTQGLYYESHNYMIYKKAGGQWRVVYEGGGGGC